MKKTILLILNVLCLLLVCGCNNGRLNYDDQNIELYVGDPYIIEVSDKSFTFEVDNNELIEINGNKVMAQSEGEVTINSINKKNSSISFKIHIIIKNIEIICKDELFEKEQIILTINKPGSAVVWESKNPYLAIISNGNILTGIKAGKVIIVAKINGLSIEKEILIKAIVIPMIIIDLPEELTIELNGKINYNLQTEPVGCEVETSILDNSIISLNGNTIEALKEGETKIIFKLKQDEVKKEIKVKVLSSEQPVFKFDTDYKEEITLNYGKALNPTIGLKVIDNVDGDITSKVRLKEEFKNNEYGKHKIELIVEDSVGNKATLTRYVNVIWNYDITFIGHAGCYYGLMNSEEAFLYAVQKLHYQALECDLKQTSDGVFVLSHDNSFGGYDIASTPWSTLKDVEHTASRKAGIPAQNGTVTKSPYTTKLCTLERYLEICKQFNAKAVIELKASKGITNTDQSRMKALMEVIENCEMRENVIFLGSQYNCLIWTRNNGYSDIECQYLVNSCESDTILERCINYNLDVSINVTATPAYANSDEWLAKYHEAGLKISTYTYTQYVDYNVVQNWIDKGVDYVTCDWQVIEKLKLPEISLEPVEEFVITFKDHNGTILKEAKVKKGATAAAPKDPTRAGYIFNGWNKSFRNVQEDMEVIALYDIIKYKIIFDDNLTTINKVSWGNKDAFTTELYTDMYNWFIKNGNDLDGVSVDEQKVTITKNKNTIDFSSVQELKDINIYVFETTVSNYLFKPVKRNSDDTCIMEYDEHYFFNSKEYRIKYQDMDQYLINCINKSYTAYDKTYKPLANGKIQILFRFHQWQQGTKIASLDNLPNKYEQIQDERVIVTIPQDIEYTIEDNIILPELKANVEFLGWYLDKECTKQVTQIEKGSIGNLILYAKWKIE